MKLQKNNYLFFIIGSLIFLSQDVKGEEDIFRQTNGANAPNHFDPKNLTDREKWDSENYVHEGLSQRTLLESCEVNEETKAACQGQAANKKFMGMSPGMVQAISRMYATVIGTMGGDFVSVDEYNKKNPPKETKTNTKEASTKSSDAKTTTDKETQDKTSNKDEESPTDYCKYVAMGTEAVALTQQNLGQKSIQKAPTTAETAQVDALHKAAREHENRSTQAKTQTIGWGVTTGCYTAMMANPYGNVSAKAWQNWAKLGASAVLTVFFKGQGDAHDEYKKKVMAIADKMPGRGDCNPVTQRDCYCAQEETKHDQKVCLPYLHREVLAKNTLRVSCIDAKLKADPKCDCIKLDNCYDKEYMSTINGLKFGSAELGATSAPFGNLARGRLTGANVSSDSSKLFAKAKTQLKNLRSKVINTGRQPQLSKGGKAESDALIKLGLPPSLANKLASTPINSSMKKAIANFRGKGRTRYNRDRNQKSRSKVLSFSGGDGINKKKSRRRKNSTDFLSKFKRNRKKGKRNSGKVLKFANRAQRQAEIHKNKGRIIFDIISHRYQTSGRRRLELNK